LLRVIALPKLVVAALVSDGEGRILLTKRRSDQPLPDQWELPGGKMEPGESPAEALARELEEEIGVRPSVGKVWYVLFHRYPEYDVVLLVYACRLAEQPRCIEVGDLAWARPEELERFDILPADRPLVARLRREGPPRFQEE
jgi:8-oxo-dGTP diphosphatase